MKAIRSWIAPNPILVKELRSRMRGSRAFITLTVALTVMAAMMIGLVSLFSQLGNSIGSMLSPQIGHILFEGLVNFEMLLVCTVTPAVTAGAISNEREKLTFEMLLSTPLGPAKILWGKLISALSYVFLLIFAAIPLASLVFLFGGIAPLTMLKALFVLVVVAITMGIYGLFLSALLGRTGRATVVSFISVMVMMIGPLVLLVITGVFGQRGILMPRFLMAFSPVSMLVSAVETVGSANSNGGVSSLFTFIGGQWDPSLNPQALTQIPRPLYHYSLAICGVLSIVLFTLSVALVNPARRFYLSKRNALTGGAALVLFAAAIGAVFLVTAPRYEWVKVAADPNQVVLGQVAFPRAGFAQQAVAVQVVGQAYPPPEPTSTPTPVEMIVTNPTQPLTPAPTATGWPTATPTVVTAMGAAMPLKDQIAIYAAAARQVYLKDSTVGGQPPKFPVVYLISMTNDRTGDPNQPDSGANLIGMDLQQGISAALSDLADRVVWVGKLDTVPKDALSGAVLEGGLAITFGNIQVQLRDGSVQLPASAYVSSGIGGGQTYRLEQVSGLWQVSGTTGAKWIQ